MTPAEASAELLRRRYGRNSLVEFSHAIDVPGKPVSGDEDEWVFQPVEAKTAKHHVLIMDTLEKVFTGEIKNLMIFAPPGSAKSSYASVVFPAYALGKRPGMKIILASYASAIAWKQSRRTRQIVKSAKYQKIFGTGALHGNASVEEWALDNKSEYMATGLLAATTGNRANLVIVDDPVSGREDAESETMRKKTREAYEDDLKTRLIPGGATIIIQTRWHEDDLSGHILPEKWNGESGDMVCRDGQIWHVLCLPAVCDRDDDPLGRAIGEPLWPEWFNEEHFAQFRAQPRTWMALFQQRPRPAEGAEFKKAWLQRYASVPRTLNKLMLVDPASGKSKTRGDFTSMWIVGLAPDGNRYILDCVRDRLNLTERTEAVFRLHRKWKPLQTRYEQYGLQSDIEHIKAEQERQQYRFQIQEVGGALKKEDRIRRLIPLYQYGQIYHPTSLMYRNTAGEDIDLQAEYEKEFAAFPVARHDDMMDSLARMEEPSLALPFPTESYEPDDYVRVYQAHDAEMGL